jgi:hypothetical protein
MPLIESYWQEEPVCSAGISSLDQSSLIDCVLEAYRD